MIRVALRRGEDFPASPVNTQSDAAQSGILVPTPLFHATGCTALMVCSNSLASSHYSNPDLTDDWDLHWFEGRPHAQMDPC